MRLTRKATAGIAIAGVIALGAAIPALAQDASEDTTTEQDDVADAREKLRDERRLEFADRVGAIVGVDGEELLAAIDQVRDEMRAEHHAERLADLEERLADAVANGRLTQEEADTILEQAQAGDLFPGRRGLGHGHGRGMGQGMGQGMRMGGGLGLGPSA